MEYHVPASRAFFVGLCDLPPLDWPMTNLFVACVFLFVEVTVDFATEAPFAAFDLVPVARLVATKAVFVSFSGWFLDDVDGTSAGGRRVVFVFGAGGGGVGVGG